jgi:hypothetical protein
MLLQPEPVSPVQCESPPSKFEGRSAYATSEVKAGSLAVLLAGTYIKKTIRHSTLSTCRWPCMRKATAECPSTSLKSYDLKLSTGAYVLGGTSEVRRPVESVWSTD